MLLAFLLGRGLLHGHFHGYHFCVRALVSRSDWSGLSALLFNRAGGFARGWVLYEVLVGDLNLLDLWSGDWRLEAYFPLL